MGFFTSCNCMLSITRLGKTNTCLVVNLRERVARYCTAWIIIEGCNGTAVNSGRCNRTAVTSGGFNSTAVTSDRTAISPPTRYKQNCSQSLYPPCTVIALCCRYCNHFHQYIHLSVWKFLLSEMWRRVDWQIILKFPMKELTSHSGVCPQRNICAFSLWKLHGLAYPIECQRWRWKFSFLRLT